MMVMKATSENGVSSPPLQSDRHIAGLPARLAARMESQRQMEILGKLKRFSHHVVLRDITSKGIEVGHEIKELHRCAKEQEDCEEELKRQLMIKTKEAERLTMEIPRLEGKLQRNVRALRQRVTERETEMERYIKLCEQQKTQIQMMRREMQKKERQHEETIRNLKLRHVQELYIARKLTQAPPR